MAKWRYFDLSFSLPLLVVIEANCSQSQIIQQIIQQIII
jgi:hypothetical protein